jgi:membrane peptidoglycan carboxypeptidase
VSNPDLPEPYWQEARHDSQWRGGLSGPEREESPWDNDRFWRADGAAGRDDNAPARNGRAPAARRPAARFQDPPRGTRGTRGTRRAPSRDDGPQSADFDRDDRGGRFSQGADDLRSRLGMRGSAAGRNRGTDDRPAGRGEPAEQPDDAFWGDSDRRRPGRLNGGRVAETMTGAFRSRTDRAAEPPRAPGPARGRAAGYGPDAGGMTEPGDAGRGPAGTGRRRADRNGPPGGRRAALDGVAAAAAGRAAYDGRYENGNGDFRPDGYDGRTALRDLPRNDWDEPGQARRGSRSRLPGGPGTPPGRGGGGGNGGGKGGGRGGDRDGFPASRGERFKNWLLYGSWWRRWTWKKALAVVGIAAASVILIAIAAFFIVYQQTPIPTGTDIAANWQSSNVYFSNGKQMGTFDAGNVERQLLSPTQIPSVMTQAMTAAEDRNFYHEGGVSVPGLLRATFDDLFGSGNLQGGSTITMQYAKNYYSDVNTGQNANTKLKEIFIAMKIGRAKSKPWVMTQYLNTVPFGTTIYGLGAASESYFNINLTKTGSQLTIAQAAMLASMPNSPGVFNPNPDAGYGYTALVARWNAVLDNMVRYGDISQAVRNQQKFPELTPPPAGNGQTGVTGYLMNMVEQQLEAPAADGGFGLTQHQIDTGGYRINTTFSPSKIAALARSISAEKSAMRTYAAEGNGTSFHNYDRIGAVLEDPKTGAIEAIYGGPGLGAKKCVGCWLNNAEAAEPVGSSFKSYVLATAVSEDMNVFTSKLNGFSPIWIPISPDTPVNQLALSATSPPPGLSVATGSGASGGNYYFLFNESSENLGVLSVNDAAAFSSDPAFEDLAHRVGNDAIIDMATKLGIGQNPFVLPCADSVHSNGSVAATIQDCNDLTGPALNVDTPGNGLKLNYSNSSSDAAASRAGTTGSPAIALGENPLTPVEQASTFATLADDGVFHAPHVVASLEQGSASIPVNVATRTVLTPEQAADVDWALSFDNQLPGATAYNNVTFRRGDVIGKTGTLGENEVASQAWFVGGTPDQAALSVSLFTNLETENLDNLPYVNAPGSQGGGWPASIWNNFMTAEYSNTAAIPLFTTDNQAPFVPWIRAMPKKKARPACKPGQFQNCRCPNGQQCTNPNPNPNPSSSCGLPFEQPCGGTSPSPSPSPPCFGQSCTSPSPSPSATCTPTFGHPCNGQTTASFSKQPGAAGATLLAVVMPGEEQLPLSVITDRIRTYAAGRSG